MDDRERLFARILRDPADTPTRMVYGDLLAERGDPRGVFISQQCRIAEMDSLDTDYPLLLSSTRRLEAKHVTTWLAPLLDRIAKRERYEHRSRNQVSQLLNPVFERGFLQRIALAPIDLAALWEWTVEWEPIDGVEVIVDEGLAAKERKQPGPFPWRHLKVSPDGWFTADSLAHVLAWGFPNVGHIDLSGCSLGVDGCRLLTNRPTTLGETFVDLVEPPPLPTSSITGWILRGSAAGDEAVKILFAGETNGQVRSIDLTQCRIEEPDTLDALREAPSFAAIRQLSLAGNNLLGSSLHRLRGWSALQTLQHLALPQTATVEDLRALFPEPSPNLRSLDLAANKPLAKSLTALLALATHFTDLNLGTTSLGDEGLQTILSAPSCASLVALKVNGCSLSDNAIMALVASPLDRLLALDVSSNKLTDKAMLALANWQGLRHVTHLRLGNNRKIGEAGFEALIRSPHLDPVELDIGSLGDEAIRRRLSERFGAAVKPRKNP